MKKQNQILVTLSIVALLGAVRKKKSNATSTIPLKTALQIGKKSSFVKQIKIAKTRR